MSQASRASEYQSAQKRIFGSLTRDLATLWRIIRLGAFATTVPRWMDGVQAAVDNRAAMAGALAVGFYRTERGLAGALGEYEPLVPGVPPEKIVASLKWATKDLWIPEREDPPKLATRLKTAEVKAAGVAQKAVADISRDVIRDAVLLDQEARGWARFANAKSCHFCALMAIRGPVYESEDTAGRDANSRFAGGGLYKFHDHCDCTVAPVFSGQDWEPPNYVRGWEALYRESTRGQRDLMKAWRRAFEGR